MLSRFLKIHVTKLGPIRNADLELSDFMIFSGDSGLGKSYLAILSHYFFEIMLACPRFEQFFEGKGLSMRSMRENLSTDEGVLARVSTGDIAEWMSRDAIGYLRYMLGNEHLDGEISVEFPEEFPEEIVIHYEWKRLGPQTGTPSLMLRIDDILYGVSDEEFIGEENPLASITGLFLCREFTGNPMGLRCAYELPPSRGAFLTEKVFPQSGLYIEFQKLLDFLNKSKVKRTETDGKLSDMMRTLLEGEVQYKDSRYIYMMDGAPIPASAAAASVRELGAIDLLIKNVDISSASLLIEEPEAHLHPLKQRLMADVMALMANSGTAMQVTTHSDYFLRRINEHIMLHRIGQYMAKDDFAAFCEETGISHTLSLNPGKIRAYLLKREGDHSVLIRQSLTDGVPFSAFCNAISRSLELEDKLSEQLALCRDGNNRSI